uniref:hypothetical protein n=1 Tax=Cellvibrio fontiphilus TaxID=1815559 RepID=UPI002B4BF351|nr:hypothetical protein [Cellvibrio fontiphilus]
MLRIQIYGYLAILFLLFSGCATQPKTMTEQLTISGVVFFPDGKPASDIELTFWWKGFGLPKSSSKILATIRSGNDGEFQQNFYVGPPYAIVAWSNDKHYSSFTILENQDLNNLKVTLKPEPTY